MTAATDVNKAVQPAKGNRDLLRIFSQSEFRKAFRENGGSALVVPSSTSRPRLPACTTNSTPSSSSFTAKSSSKLSTSLPRLPNNGSSNPTSSPQLIILPQQHHVESNSNRSERDANGNDLDLERDGSRGISDEEDGDACRKKLRLSKDQSPLSLRHPTRPLLTIRAPLSRCWTVVPTLSPRRLNLHQLLHRPLGFPSPSA
ncbi:hypothetical protein ACFX2J_014253 [Malus domestica]